MECKIVGGMTKTEEKINEFLKGLEKKGKVINAIVQHGDFHIIIFFGNPVPQPEIKMPDFSKLLEVIGKVGSLQEGKKK